MSVPTPPQTDTYCTGLDIYDHTQPLTVDATNRLRVTATLESGSIEIGTVDQGAAGTDPWLVDVTNTVNTIVTNFPATQAISGTVTALQGTSPWVISGTVVATPTGTQDVNIVSTIPVPVTDNGGSLTIDGTVAVSNFPATQPVSGTVTANQGTSPWVVSGSIVTSPDVNVHDGTGNSISSTAGSLNVDVTNIVPVSQSGTWNINNISGTISLPTGAATEATLSGIKTDTDKFTFAATRLIVDGSQVTQPISGTVSVSGSVAVTGPLTDTQLRASPVPISGTVTANAGSGTFLVDGSAHTQPVSGTVSISGSVAVTGPLTDAQLRATPVPVSGTVTANLGTVDGLALDATLTGGTQQTKIVQGGNTAVVDATGDLQVDVNNFPATVAVTQSTSPWVSNVSNGAGASAVNIQDGGNSITVDGTITANAGTGNFTVVQPTGTNLHTVLDSGTLTSITNALPAGTNVIGHVITDTGSTTAVTGNVTVVQPTGTNLHTVVDSGSITVTNAAGASAVNIQDGGNSITVDGTVAATQSGTWTVQPGNTPNTSPWLIEQRAPGTLTTYSASTLGLVAAATPTDIFTIYGSGTKTIKVVRLEISATQNTAAIRDLVLIKRSTTNTGGTSASVTKVPHDSNNAAATATVLSYTANPAALGTSVGNIRTAKVDIPATNLVGNADRIIWTFGDRPGQAVVLRGTTEGLAVNLNSVTSASNSFDINLEWTEE